MLKIDRLESQMIIKTLEPNKTNGLKRDSQNRLWSSMPVGGEP
jgi:hypothetical protein